MFELSVSSTTLSVFIGMVVFMLFIDFYNHRENKVVTIASATRWSVFYVIAALMFSYYISLVQGPEQASLFLTGYALEKVLAFDNLFVFSLIFAYFKIPEKLQHKALYWGIAGAIVFRFLFVGIGAGLLEKYGAIVEVAFAAILLYTIYVIWTAEDKGPKNYDKVWYVRAIRKIHPGATTFFIAVVVIELSDIVFSFDSVPAIIAVTKDPFLIYSAMLFAILGLRSMYFLIAGLMRYFRYMDQAVMVVLLLIAAKLLAGSLLDLHLDPIVSLVIILATLGTGVAASLIIPEEKEL